MERRTILIVILIVALLVVAAGVVLFMSLTSDGSPEEAATERRGNIFPFFGGLGDGDGDTTVGESGLSGDREEGSSFPEGGALPRFRKLWSEPVAGAAFAENASGSTTVHFVERATGHVYEASPTSTRTVRLTNTTIPKVQEARFVSPDRILVRYLRDDDTIETFAGTILPPPEPIGTSTEEAVGELSGQFLPVNILGVASVGNSLFYLTSSGSGVRGIVSGFDGSGAREVFSSPVRDWIVESVSGSTVALTTKAAAGIPGHLFFLNTGSGTLTPVLANFEGLTTLVRDSLVLYAQHTSIVPSVFVYDRESDKTVSLPLSTLSEKCAWGGGSAPVVLCAVPEGVTGETLPDAWYQGVAHTDDSVWEFDASTLSSRVVFDPSTYASGSFDLDSVSVSEDGRYAIMRNRPDGTLWLFELTTPSLPSPLDE